MLELFLNLVWLALALISLWAFGRKQASGESFGLPSLKGWLSLLTLLIILFPVISISDDFHPVMEAQEDSARRISQLSASLHHMQDGRSTALLPFTLRDQTSTTLAVVQDRSTKDVVPAAAQVERVPLEGRSPPSF